MKTAILILVTVLVAGCGGGGGEKSGTTPAATPAPTAKAPDETSILAAIGEFNQAQSYYFKRNRRYALGYEDLLEARDLKSEPTAAETGYNLRIRPAANAQTYTLAAVPASPSGTARHFFTDQTGVVRAEQGKDATVQSPAIDKTAK